jgi:polysaccharide chain length determinant protein (PEP-CTERM system associated)
MATVWIVTIAGWFYISNLPNQYQASAKVLVDTDSMLRPLLRGLAIQSNVSQRVQLMTRTLLSRPNLEKVARMTDLDLKAKTTGAMNSLVAQLKSSIRLIGTRNQDLYTITATHSNPETAKDIVQAVLTIFIEDTLGGARNDSDVAQKFLMQQIKEYETRLVEAETRIKKFKQENIGRMSGDGRGYFEKLQLAESELEQAKLRLREAEKRRDELKRQLSGEEPVFGFGTKGSSTNLRPHHLDNRINALRTQIDELLLVYTDQHPNVITRQEQLRDLEREREDDLKTKPQQIARPKQQLDTNPVYQQLRISLGQAEVEVSSLSVRVQEYENRVSKLKNLVNVGPELEAELKALDRDYALNKRNYNTLIARLESAKLAEEAEQTGDNVKFETIEPPRVPLAPSGPNRLLLSTVSLMAGLAVGFSLAFLLSQLRPTIYDRRTLKEVSGYPVFGVVSRYWTPELLFRKRVEFGAFLAVGTVLALVFAGVIVSQQMDIALFEQLGKILEL